MYVSRSTQRIWSTVEGYIGGLWTPNWTATQPRPGVIGPNTVGVEQYILYRIKSVKRLFDVRRVVPSQRVNVVLKINGGIQMGSHYSLAGPTLLAGDQISCCRCRLLRH